MCSGDSVVGSTALTGDIARLMGFLLRSVTVGAGVFNRYDYGGQASFIADQVA